MSEVVLIRMYTFLKPIIERDDGKNSKTGVATRPTKTCMA